jgi:hypothetical protein
VSETDFHHEQDADERELSGLFRGRSTRARSMQVSFSASHSRTLGFFQTLPIFAATRNKSVSYQFS